MGQAFSTRKRRQEQTEESLLTKNARIRKLREEVDRLQQTNDFLNSEYNKKKLEVQRLKEENNKQYVEINLLKSRETMTNLSIQTTNNTILQLKKEYDAAKSEALRFKEENNLLSRKINSLRYKSAETTWARGTNNQENLQLRRDMEKLQQENERLNQENIKQRNLLIPQTEEERVLQEMLGEDYNFSVKLKVKLALVERVIEKNTKSSQTDQDDLILKDLVHTTPTGLVPHFPNFPKTIHQWFKIPIKRYRRTEPPGLPRKGFIDGLNLNATTFYPKEILKDKIKCALAMGDSVFYHATNTDGAKNILRFGIDVTKSRRKTDFSNGRGFYVTDSFEKACAWSKRVVGWRGSKGAIIVFRTNYSLLDERHLNLTVDNDTNRKWWECIVSHFRHGETSSDVTNILKDVKYIEGPVAKVKSLDLHEIPTPFDFSQLCICNQDFARKFGSLKNICCVIFFN